jgi:opacity protein-like surface antigen
VNQNHWGKQGFSENRIMSGLSYQMTPHVGMDLGYLGQYVDNLTGNNLFTHNIQVNFRYKF